MFNKKRLLVFLIDIVLIAVAFCAAFLLRFDFHLPDHYLLIFKHAFAIVLISKPLVFLSSGMYRNLWSYASLQDAFAIAKAVTIASVVAGFGLIFIREFDEFSRSIFVLDWGLLLALVATSRLVWRAYREKTLVPRAWRDMRRQSRTLVVGAGQAGSLLLKEIRRQADSPYNVVGFIDDDPEKQNMRLHGIPVLGTSEQLEKLVKKHVIEKVIIAIPSASGKTVRSIVSSCKNANVRFKILPGITDILKGVVSVSQVKDVDIEDLLGRAPVSLDENAIRSYLSGKKILVTGAAGSIGSEICRQVARFGPRKVVLFDDAETPLFYIERELAAKYPDLRIIPVMGNIRNTERIETVFREFTPDVVFHAAAYKHVPMMEYNPSEAVLNNVMGTKVLADAAHRCRVKNFVMISTDKAVNPTNVMGATKRAAEIYVQALAGKSATKFTTVRFGNVLGSNGSVIPLFKEQIRKGGPVTVTDPRVIRYFMTIPEASQLVLQAGCLGNGGEIFVLDMGEPVRIVDLAEELIRLSGFVPYEEIDITFTGLRPGEKLFEELLIDGEGVKPTIHEKIRVISPIESNLDALQGELALLFRHAKEGSLSSAMQSLLRLVPEFTPRYEFPGEPPELFRRMRGDLFPRNVAVGAGAKVLPFSGATGG